MSDIIVYSLDFVKSKSECDDGIALRFHACGYINTYGTNGCFHYASMKTNVYFAIFQVTVIVHSYITLCSTALDRMIVGITGRGSPWNCTRVLRGVI